MGKLTAVQIRNAKPKGKPYKLSDGYGLFFHVAKSGKKTWRYRFKVMGTESTFVLGEYPPMGLSDAREALINARQLVKVGINPAEARKEEIAASHKEKKAAENSFEKITLEWIDKQQGRWSPNHSAAISKSLNKNVFPEIGHLQIDSITPPQLVTLFEKIENRGALEVARKVLQRVSSIYMYAIRTGRATVNPAASLKGSLKTRKVAHHAALSLDELPEFLSRLSKAKIHITTRLGLKFLILTAARSAEVRGATWAEIDLQDKMWRIPAERMKMDLPHSVPLSEQAIEVLNQIGDTFGRGGYIFPGIRNFNKPMSQNTLLYAMHGLGYHSKATVHGFRATFSTIANENEFDGDVIEKALAHTERNRVRAAYHRSEYLEQRRELMQWWGNKLQALECGPEVADFLENLDGGGS